MKQNRLKSWALWLAMAALVVFAVKTAFGVDLGATINTMMDLLLPVLVGFGVINNPTSKDAL